MKKKREINPVAVVLVLMILAFAIALFCAFPARAHGRSADNEQAVGLWSPGKTARSWEFIGSSQDASFWFATQNRGTWLGVTLKVGERSPDGKIRAVQLVDALVQCQPDHHAPPTAGFLGVSSFDLDTGEQIGQYVSPDIGGTTVNLRPSSAFGQAIDNACQERGQQ